MKKLFLLFLCTPLLLKAQYDKGIQFNETLSWEQIQAKAKAENKYVFVDAYATWCGPCKMMDRDVYPAEAVGKAMNDKFIAVKVQIDETPKDDARTQAWYNDARQLKEDYKITALPTFLFFGPDGQLLYKDFGYRNAADFAKLAVAALDPEKRAVYNELADYNKGQKDYSRMGELAIFVKKVMGKKEKADSIAKDYKAVLDKRSTGTIYTKENLDFINDFYYLMSSKDPFFALCRHQPTAADSIMGREGWAKSQVWQTVMREEIENKLLKDGKPLNTEPKWDKMQATINKKYANLDAKKMILDYQIYYYDRYVKDWEKWAFYTDQRIKEYPPQPGMQSFGELNMPAWNTFLHCDNRKVLEKALEWSDLSIKGYEPKEVLQQLDTRANLLYKLGKVQEAIEQEQVALETSNSMQGKPFQRDFVETLDKMKKGMPTWPQK